MTCTNRFCMLVAGGMALVGLLILSSWATTHILWDGRMPIGQWFLHISDEMGRPIPDAAMEIISPKGRSLSTPGVESSGPFDNYAGPGSLASDSQGVIMLRNIRELPYGGSCWKLLWIWPIGACPAQSPGSLIVRINSQGHEPAATTIETILSQGHVALILHTKSK